MKTEKLGSAKNGSNKIVGRARTEKNAQKRLDTMQIAVAMGMVVLSKAAEAAKKELETILKNRTKLSELKQEHVSDLTELQRLADNEFPNVTLEELQEEETAKAERFISRLINATNEQKEIVSRYHGIVAAKTWNVVSQIRAVLTAFHKSVSAPRTEVNAQVREGVTA